MLVAVYGSLKQGFGNDYHLEDSKFVGDDTLDGFEMYSLGAFPAVMYGEGSIDVEVYDIDDATLNVLDKIEGYFGSSAFNMYDREKVLTKYGESFIYVWTDRSIKSTRKQIETGNWEKKNYLPVLHRY